MYDTILLAHDGSEVADAAIPHAHELARKFNSRVIVVEVIQTVGEVLVATGAGALQATLPTELAEQVVEDERRRAEATVARIAEAMRRADIFTARRVIAEGDPGSAIVDVAEREGCDLIVMATHGRSGIRRAVLGSVADYVLRHASCPVLLCRPSE
jgi:nucleotide-binding universal stress UspA family protein